MTALRLVIDCDPGLDDALAIALAAASPELQVAAIATVAGNAGIEMVSQNALSIVEALGAQVPVYSGSGKPMAGETRLGTALWGGDGGLGFPIVKNSGVSPALDGYTNLLAAGQSTIAAIGPLTNLALLLDRHPHSARRIERIAIMGGAFGRGNATPCAEFNFWADPYAAAAVLASGIPAVIAPLDVTREMLVSKDMIRRLKESSGRSACFFSILLPLAGKPGHPTAIHDACTVAWLLWPDLFETKRGIVSVEMHDGERRGAARFEPDLQGPHTILTKVDRSSLLERIVARLCGHG